MRTRFLPVWLLAIALIGTGLWQGNCDPVQAATLYVTNNLDSGAGSLRNAVSGSANGDTVAIVTPGPIHITSPVNITQDITINGPAIAVDPTKDPENKFPAETGQVAIVSGGNGSVFYISAGNVTLTHLYITGGVASGTSSNTGAGDPAFGGGIYNAGSLSLDYCTIENNSALGGDGADAGGNASGGGIYSIGQLTVNHSTIQNNLASGGNGGAANGGAAFGAGVYSTSTTDIRNSTFYQNVAEGGNSASATGGGVNGGGVAQKNAGSLSLTNVTFNANQAIGGTGGAGGVAYGGAVLATGSSFTLNSATIVGNKVDGSGTNFGAGVYYSGSAALTVNNSIIANNAGAADLQVSGTTPGYNTFGSPGINTFSGAVVLNALASNGGPTETMSSIDTAYVVNVGDSSVKPMSEVLDQRGAPRVFDGAMDAGAMENGVNPPTNAPPNPMPFNFQILNGTANFTAAQFIGAVDYPDPGDSLKSIVLTTVPLTTTGYFKLNGQKLTKDSVISVADLDNLVFVSNDPSNTSAIFTWTPSDGVNPLPAVMHAGQPIPDVPAATPAHGGDPSLTVVDGPSGTIFANPGDTQTFSFTAQSTSILTPAQVGPPAVAANTKTSITVLANKESFTDSEKDVSIVSSPVTVILTSGYHTIPVIATNIHGATNTYTISYFVDMLPQFTNKDTITSPISINLGDTFTRELTAFDPDYTVPQDHSLNPNISPEPLRFQIDQTCYGNNSTCDNSNTVSNIGNFSSTDLTGNLDSGTTLDTIFNWKPTAAGIYGLKVTLTDYWGGSDTFVFSVIVNQPTNSPPVINNPGTQTAVKGTPFSLPIVVTDADTAQDLLTYSVSGLPPGLSYIETTTGIKISGIPTSTVESPFTVTLGASDGQHTTATTATFTIIVKDVGSPAIDNILVNGVAMSSPVNVAANQDFNGLQATAHVGNYPDNLTFLTYEGTPATPVGNWTVTNTTGSPISNLLTSTASFSWPNVPPGVHVVTVRVTADNGEFDERTFTIQAGNAPTLTITPSGTVSIPANHAFSINADGVDTDSNETLTFSVGPNAPTGVSIPGQASFSNVPANTPKHATVTFTPTDAQAGNSYTFNVIVTDSAGLQDMKAITINVDPAVANQPPTVQNPGSQTVNVGDNANIQIVATDPDTPPVSLLYSSTTLPGWASINPATGLITGQPGNGNVGPTDVTVNVSDGPNTVPITFTLTVVQSQSGNQPPVVQNPGTLIATSGSMFNKQIVATDSDGDILHFTGTNFPTWAQISDSGIISGMPGPGDAGSTTSITVSVTDGKPTGAPDSVSVTFDLKVVGHDEPIDVTNPGPQTASVGSFFTVSIPASDPNGDPITYALTAPATPTWLTLSPGGVLSGTPTSGDIGTTNVKITVSDADDAPVTISFPIMVSGSGAPTLQATPYAPANPEQVQVNHGYSKMFISHDSEYDPTPAQNLTFTATVTAMAGGPVNRPSPATFMDPIYEAGSTSNGTDAAATFNWTPNKPGTYKVVVTVTDKDGNSTSQTFTIHVSSPPMISITPPTTINAVPGMPITPMPVNVWDADDHENLIVTLDSNAPAGMTIQSPSSFSNLSPPSTHGVTYINFTPTDAQANNSYTFNVIVTDSAMHTDTQSVTINVGSVNARPVITSPTAGSKLNVVTNHTVSLSVVATDTEDDPLYYNATGLTAIGSTITIDHSTGIISGLVTATSGTFPVTVTVDDDNHVSPAASTTFKIVVGATNHPPVWSVIPDQTIGEGQPFNLDLSQYASDQDNDALTYSNTTPLPVWATLTNGVITNNAATTAGSTNVTVKADDNYTGGTATQSFRITVQSAFGVTFSQDNGGGYGTITYRITNNTGSTISPVVTGSLTGLGYMNNSLASFNPSQGFVDTQWASPIIERQLNPTKNTRLVTWTLGSLAPGKTATLAIAVPIAGNTPTNQQLTNQWIIQYGSVGGPVTHPVSPVTTLTSP